MELNSLLPSFVEELAKIAVSVNDISSFLTRTPYGGALVGAGLGAGAGAGIGALSGEKGKRGKRALIGAGVGAGLGGLSGAAVGAARQLPVSRVLSQPTTVAHKPAFRALDTEKLAPSKVTELAREITRKAKGTSSQRLRRLTSPAHIVADSQRTIRPGGSRVAARLMALRPARATR